MFEANIHHTQAKCTMTIHEFRHLERVMFPAFIQHIWAVNRAPVTTFLSL